MHPPVDSPLCSTTTGCHHRPWVIPRPAARPFVLWRELETRQTCPQGTLHFLSQYCRLSPCKPLSRRRKGKEVYSPSSSPLLSSPLLMILLRDWKKNIWQCLPYYHQCQQERDKDREFIQSHAPLSILSLFFLCHDFSTEDPKRRSPLRPPPCFTAAWG